MINNREHIDMRPIAFYNMRTIGHICAGQILMKGKKVC